MNATSIANPLTTSVSARTGPKPAVAPPVEPVSAIAPPVEPVSAVAPLVARLAARVSSSLDEIVAFGSPAAAIESIGRRLLAGRSVAIGDGVPDDLRRAVAANARASTAARWIDVAPDRVVQTLVESTSASDVAVLSSPVVGRGAAIAPRELLQLRSRNLRSLIVLDLRDEDLASSPLTQTALLLPGTIAIRGFGGIWRDAGAPEVAGLAFVTGPSREIAPLRTDALGAVATDAACVRAACAALDRTDIDRRVREAALAWRAERRSR